MTLFFYSLPDHQLGYAAIFFFIAIGFSFLHIIDRKVIGPGYWAITFFLNGIGFLFWSVVIPFPPLLDYLIGEVFHIAGFTFMVCGAYRFTQHEYNRWNLLFITSLLLFWVVGILCFKSSQAVAALILKLTRTILFMTGGLILIKDREKGRVDGRLLTGWSLVLWGLYVMAYGFIRTDKGSGFLYGLLVGMQILAALGMVVMVVESMKNRAERSERRIKELEGLLPICSYCKKIRDKDGRWNVLEAYIEERSTAEFSHGICPDCMEKHAREIGR